MSEVESNELRHANNTLEAEVKSQDEYSPTQTQYRPSTALTEEPFATLSSRFAAFFIDSVLLGTILSLIHRLVASRFPLPSWDATNWDTLKHLPAFGMIAAIALAYFFLFEGILGRTPGKALCGLNVSHRLGGPASLTGVLIRNLLRFIDILFFPILGFACAEVTEKRQRFGDLLGNTSVRYSRNLEPPIQGSTQMPPASITRRSFAIILDLLIFAISSLAFLLALPISQVETTHLLLQTAPILGFIYWIACDSLLGGTPAKLLLSLHIVDLEGRPVSVSGSLMRNLFRFFDHNPVGYLAAMLSAQKQRTGDLAANTRVIRSQWNLRRFGAIIVIFGIISGLAYFGINNKDNFIRQERIVRVGPWQLPDLPSRAKYFLGLRLKVSQFFFGKPSAPIRDTEPMYTPGEIVYLSAEVSGFIVKDEHIWLQQDLLVLNPEGDAFIDMLNVVNKKYPAPSSGRQVMTSSFLLPLRLPAGPYIVKAKLRDRYGNMIGEANNKFLVQ